MRGRISIGILVSLTTLAVGCGPSIDSARFGGSKYSVMQVSGALAPGTKRTMPLCMNGVNFTYQMLPSAGLTPSPYR